MKNIIALTTLLVCLCVATGCSSLACKDYFRATGHPYSDLNMREQTRYMIDMPKRATYVEQGIPHSQKVYGGYYSITIMPGSRYADYAYFTRKHDNVHVKGTNRKFFEGYIGPRRLDTRDRYVPRRQYHDYDKD